MFAAISQLQWCIIWQAKKQHDVDDAFHVIYLKLKRLIDEFRVSKKIKTEMIHIAY